MASNAIIDDSVFELFFPALFLSYITIYICVCIKSYFSGINIYKLIINAFNAVIIKRQKIRTNKKYQQKVDKQVRT